MKPWHDDWLPPSLCSIGGPGSGYYGHPGRPGSVGGSVSTGGPKPYDPEQRHKLYLAQKSDDTKEKRGPRVYEYGPPGHKMKDTEEKKTKEQIESEINERIDKDIEIDKKMDADDISNIEEDSKERAAFIELMEKHREQRVKDMERRGKPTKEDIEKDPTIRDIDKTIKDVQDRERRARDKQKELKDKQAPLG